MAVHGVAGYMSGCRCEQCFAAQRHRERQLAVASEARWAAIVRQIDLTEARPAVTKSPTWRDAQIDEQQRMTEVAELELRRQRRSLERQQRKIARKQETARQRAQAAREMQERYERAVVERDFRWLLAAERRAVNSLRTRISRLVDADTRKDYYELLWRQAQQTRELAEVHYRELNDRIGAVAGGVTPQGLR
ncbi:Uncharacterised protein [Mycobacteroides abscessus subsp. bolletii]|nr:Uncharacterised protein [Mycobacteroides abscessus subsp. bolletii]SHW20105.1 Uncharacterised protein [Mycobacteroides abscessus subsp. bolletii]SHW50821.1 Uncharacterised protein [Mycobacteroides abscessus subsp. bolletii]SHX94696.1 Uncharacterised protein [Mycobacteroides abscessus subsp. bolletii]SKS67198.1 Uncharacterised protein [Mycobacteroides abscessus subsp. bolletii]